MATSFKTYDTLKTKQRELREGFSDNLGLRVHRAISWLGRAEQETGDADAKFVFLWISFNAAYAQDIEGEFSGASRGEMAQFFKKIISLDRANRLFNIMSQFPEQIQSFLDNHYVYQPFWNYHNQIPGYDDWQRKFNSSRAIAVDAFEKQDMPKILSILFDRLYVLRNQLIHGGATWNSSVNRAQTTDGGDILHYVLPIVLDVMMNHPNEPWGNAYYPVVSE